jgi:hypothetical protein
MDTKKGVSLKKGRGEDKDRYSRNGMHVQGSMPPKLYLPGVVVVVVPLACEEGDCYRMTEDSVTRAFAGTVDCHRSIISVLRQCPAPGPAVVSHSSNLAMKFLIADNVAYIPTPYAR